LGSAGLLRRTRLVVVVPGETICYDTGRNTARRPECRMSFYGP
jgi:hypothetical protein